jgi:hypothetical protein
MILPNTAVLGRMLRSAKFAALLAFLIATVAEWYRIESGNP